VILKVPLHNVLGLVFNEKILKSNFRKCPKFYFGSVTMSSLLSVTFPSTVCSATTPETTRSVEISPKWCAARCHSGTSDNLEKCAKFDPHDHFRNITRFEQKNQKYYFRKIFKISLNLGNSRILRFLSVILSTSLRSLWRPTRGQCGVNQPSQAAPFNHRRHHQQLIKSSVL
jgi:hypothetical protein